MSKFYLMEYSTQEGQRIGRAIGPAEPEDFVKFIDLFREQGADVAMPTFPLNWVWYDDEDQVLPVLDWLPTLASGMVMSARAYRAVGAYFPEQSTPHVVLTLDGATYHWLGIPILKGSPESIDDLCIADGFPVVKLLPGAIAVCRANFSKAWSSAGLTGGVFTLLIT